MTGLQQFAQESGSPVQVTAGQQLHGRFSAEQKVIQVIPSPCRPQIFLGGLGASACVAEGFRQTQCDSTVVGTGILKKAAGQSVELGRMVKGQGVLGLAGGSQIMLSRLFALSGPLKVNGNRLHIRFRHLCHDFRDPLVVNSACLRRNPMGETLTDPVVIRFQTFPVPERDHPHKVSRPELGNERALGWVRTRGREGILNRQRLGCHNHHLEQASSRFGKRGHPISEHCLQAERTRSPRIGRDPAARWYSPNSWMR